MKTNDNRYVYFFTYSNESIVSMFFECQEEDINSNTCFKRKEIEEQREDYDIYLHYKAIQSPLLKAILEE